MFWIWDREQRRVVYVKRTIRGVPASKVNTLYREINVRARRRDDVRFPAQEECSHQVATCVGRLRELGGGKSREAQGPGPVAGLGKSFGNWLKSGSEPTPLWRRDPGLNLFAGKCKNPSYLLDEIRLRAKEMIKAGPVLASLNQPRRPERLQGIGDHSDRLIRPQTAAAAPRCLQSRLRPD